MDISNFLPKYPEINPSKDMNPYPKNSFNEVVLRKKEFYDERLSSIEKAPTIQGELMKHQKFISRFFSSYTPYDGALLFHEMGTGKGCSAIGVIEKIKNEENNFKRAIILAKGKGILDNIIDELVYTCTDGRYIPQESGLNETTKRIRIRKNLKTFYDFKTFYTFSSTLSNMSDEQIRKVYSDSIVVIDEAHNLRIQHKKKSKKLYVYDQIDRFLHNIDNKKVLLLTGTPMKDQPEEIASIMNLILPKNNQLDTGDKFRQKYLTDDLKINDENRNNLQKYFKGRVSYLKAMTNIVDKVYTGKRLGKLNLFKVYPDYMKNIQNKIYRNIFSYEVKNIDKDIGNIDDDDDDDDKKKHGWYTNSRQASLFVYPNGDTGSKGFEKYLKETVKIKGIGDQKSINNYTLTKELKDAINNNLDNLKKFSSKYATVIEKILEYSLENNDIDKRKSCFVYCNFVKGSGLILFSKLLQQFGYTRSNGTEKTKAKRYILLTHETTTDREMRRLKDRFNRKDNMNGEYIQIILGSKVIGEGFSFKNVQQVHILTPHWNFSETDQAIARVFRTFSHEDLLKKYKKLIIDVYLHVSIPENRKYDESVDIIMYKKSEEKDLVIKKIERLLKESAFDCALNYERNSNYTKDYSRECEYMKCPYTCEGVPDRLLKNKVKNLDLITFDIYYDQELVTELTKIITEIFQRHFNLHFLTIQNIINNSKYTAFQILSALRHMINKSIIIYNKYGIESYLKEENNSYFLVDSLSTDPNFLSMYYTSHPVLCDLNNFEDIVDKKYINNLPKIIKKIKDTEDKDLIVTLPLRIQELLLESAVLAEYKHVKSSFRQFILNFYKNFLTKINENILVSSLLKDELDILRCFNKGKWQNCNINIQDKYEKELRHKVDKLEKSAIGYFGIIENGKFRIRNVTDKDAVEAIDRRKRTTGKVCSYWGREVLTKIGYHIKIPVPLSQELINIIPLSSRKTISNRSQFLLKKSIDDLRLLIKNNNQYKYSLQMIKDNKLKIDKLSKEDLLTIAFCGIMKKEPLCNLIRNYFEQNNLISYRTKKVK